MSWAICPLYGECKEISVLAVWSRILDPSARVRGGFSQGSFTKTPFNIEHASNIDIVMNRTALALTLVLAMIIGGVQTVKVVEANFYPFGIPTVEPLSPQAFPYIYVTPKVDISFNYNAQKNLTQVASFSYSLDKNANVTLTSEITDLYSD
jgi:hypothetical protein